MFAAHSKGPESKKLLKPRPAEPKSKSQQKSFKRINRRSASVPVRRRSNRLLRNAVCFMGEMAPSRRLRGSFGLFIVSQNKISTIMRFINRIFTVEKGNGSQPVPFPHITISSNISLRLQESNHLLPKSCPKPSSAL